MKTGSTVCRKIFEKDVQTEVVRDYILADYMPDVLQILYVDAGIRPLSSAAEGENIVSEAELCFTIVYLSENKDIRSALYTDKAELSAAVKGLTPSMEHIIRYSEPDSTVRLSNPRKFSCRSVCPAHITVYTNDGTEPYIDGKQDRSLQYRTTVMPVYSVSTSSEVKIPVSEDLKIPPSLPEISELIAVFPSAKITDISVKDGYASCRGDIYLTVFYSYGAPDKIRYTSYTAAVPINKSIPTDSSGRVCTAEVYVHSLDADASNDASGEKRTVQTDFLCDIRLTCEEEREISCISDIYSTEFECESVKSTVKRERLFDSVRSHISVGGKAPVSVLGDALPSEIVFSRAQCVSCEVQMKDSVTLTGELMIYCICTDNDGAYGKSFKLPFRGEFGHGGVPSDAECVSAFGVDAPSVRFDKEYVYADTEMYFDMHFSKGEDTELLTAVRISDTPVTRSDAAFTVCRLQKGEDIWDIAKRHHVPLSDVALSPDPSVAVVTPSVR